MRERERERERERDCSPLPSKCRTIVDRCTNILPFLDLKIFLELKISPALLSIFLSVSLRTGRQEIDIEDVDK